MESTCAQLRQRLDQANKERDLALQNAQELADELDLLTKERDNLIESGNQSYQQIEALQYQLEEMAQKSVYYWQSNDLPFIFILVITLLQVKINLISSRLS